MRRYTVDEILSCSNYTRESLEELWDGEVELDVFEILTLPIFAEDIIWCCSHILDDTTLRLFACACAERALDAERAAGREPDERLWATIEVSRRYALGEASSDELSLIFTIAYEIAIDTVEVSSRTAAYAVYTTAVHDVFVAAFYAAVAAVDSALAAAGGYNNIAVREAVHDEQLSILYAFVQQREEQEG